MMTLCMDVQQHHSGQLLLPPQSTATEAEAAKKSAATEAEATAEESTNASTTNRDADIDQTTAEQMFYRRGGREKTFFEVLVRAQ